MFTAWEQVKSWIEDNNFPHWQFFTTPPDKRGEKTNELIIDSNNFTVSDLSDKLDMTEKYLRMYGQKAYGVGFKTPNATYGGLICEVRLQDAQEQQTTNGIYGAQQPMDIGAIEERVEKRLRSVIESEMRERDYQKRLAELEKREKQMDEDKQSALGAIVHYFAPVGQMLMKQKMGLGDRMVAGVDAQEPVHAQPIVATRSEEQPEFDEPDTKQPETESAWNAFTDEEGERIAELMAKWKEADPDYLTLLESVVTMAVNGDSKYTMAKSFL